MKRTPRKFHDPIDTGYREHPPRLFTAAVEACERLENSADTEALHDFRVAARRLRTHIEAHHLGIGKRRRDKLLERLGELVSTTNPTRDHEVQRQWLERQVRRKGLPKLQREGLNLVLHAMNRSAIDHVSPTSVGREFRRIGRAFKLDRLGSLNGRGADAARGRRLSAVAASAMLKNATILRRQLGKLGSLDDVKATHRARLAVKRLRYLVEPLEPLMPGARRIIHDLKRMQDRLGDLRDLQILETHFTVKVGEAAGRWSKRLVAAGAQDARVAAITRGTPENRACYALAAGMQRIRREGRREFKALEKRWLHSGANRLLDRIEHLAKRL